MILIYITTVRRNDKGSLNLSILSECHRIYKSEKILFSLPAGNLSSVKLRKSSIGKHIMLPFYFQNDLIAQFSKREMNHSNSFPVFLRCKVIEKMCYLSLSIKTFA